MLAEALVQFYPMAERLVRDTSTRALVGPVVDGTPELGVLEHDPHRSRRNSRDGSKRARVRRGREVRWRLRPRGRRRRHRDGQWGKRKGDDSARESEARGQCDIG